MKPSLLFAFFSIALAASHSNAAHEIRGTYQLHKGTPGCSQEIQVEDQKTCEGLAIRSQKSDLEFCNLNNGKFLKRWSHQGRKYFSESRSKQNETLYYQTEIVKIQNGKVWKKISENTNSAFFRGGRLEVQRLHQNKASTCLYSRAQSFSLSASQN